MNNSNNSLRKTGRELGIQFLKFGLVGITNTGISYLVNITVIYFMSRLEISWDYVAGNVSAFIVGTVWSFFMNKNYVFIKKENQEMGGIWGRLIKAFFVYGFTGIILNNALSYFWITCFGISKYLAPILNLVVSVPVNFLLNKTWVFKNEQNK